MKKAPVEQKDPGLRVVLLLFLGLACMSALAIIAGRSFVSHGGVISYEQCIVQKGRVIQESYPSVCVTKDGKRFVNPAQQHQCGRSGYLVNKDLCRQ